MAGRRQFKKLSDVRRYLGQVLNRFEAGELDAAHAKTVTYVCNTLSGVMKEADVEERLDKIEQQMKEQQHSEKH